MFSYESFVYKKIRVERNDRVLRFQILDKLSREFALTIERVLSYELTNVFLKAI